MTAAVSFWALTVAAVALAWTLLCAGLRRSVGTGVERRVGVGLFDEHVAALDADRATGALDAERHAEAMAELQRRLLVESGAAGAAGAGVGRAGASLETVERARPSANRRGLVTVLAIALPAFVIGGYLALGNPAALTARPPAETAANDEVTPEQMRQMVDLLAQRLQSRPAGQAEDLPGWVMLARSQAALQRFPEAAAAYERAVALAPGDAQLLADLADVLTMLQDPGGAERAQALIDRSLAADPRNVKALALAGNAAFERRDTSAAIDFWRRARSLAPAGSEFAGALDRNLASAGAATESGVAVDSAPAAAPSRVGRADAGPNGGSATVVKGVSGDIRIAPELAARVGPNDTLFVFARAVDGPRMPLAILRRPASTLPGTFTLDDSMAMAPELRLSNFTNVVIGARISRSGEALPQSGDLVGEARTAVGQGRLALVVDRIQP